MNHEICQEDFDCSRMGKTVSVKKTYLVHRNSNTGQIDKKFITEFDCEDKKECGVQDDASGNIDWDKCVHPER